MKKFPAICLILITFPFANIFAQGTYIPLNGDSYHLIDRLNIRYGKVLPAFHTVIKPYSRKKVAEYAQAVTHANITGNKRFQYNHRYHYRENSEWLEDTIIKSRRPFLRVFYPEPANMFAVNTKPFILKVNPVLHLQTGGELNSGQFKFFNTRGLELRGYIMKKLGFYAYLGENQQRNMTYVQDRITEGPEALPGEGYFKEFKTTAVDYFTARGYVIFNVLGHIDVSFGHDKHFIGNGIRSMFLSDHGANYLFLKLQTTIWKVSYTNLFTQMTATYDRGLDTLLPVKYAVFHHLNFHIAEWLDIGLFEAVVFQRENHFELQYLNPIIFYRAIEQQAGSPDNAILGIDFKSNLGRRVQLYGQFLLDEFKLGEIKGATGWWANKFAVQAGVKYPDMMGIPYLDGQVEFNWARPYTYTHNNTGSSYTHYNQPLAHPLGANFWELLIHLRYQMTQRLTTNARVMYAVKGNDPAGEHWGGNIFLPTNGPTVQREFDNRVGQGIKHRITLLDFLVSYQLKHQLFFEFNMKVRNLKSTVESQNNTQVYFGAAMRLNIPHRSYDF